MKDTIELPDEILDDPTKIREIKEDFPEDIFIDPIKYLYLRRKRLFPINTEDDEYYGEGEQDSFALVYSSDRLEKQFPLRQFSITMPHWAEPSTYDYKNEYFSVVDLPQIDPLKSTKSTQILVRSYEQDGSNKIVENPIEEFINALKIIIENNDGVGDYR
jgi:hypothetical protein